MTNISSNVLEYLQKNFNSPFYLKTNKYEVGTILYTSNPYLRTNATIISILKEDMYQVLTDIGNVIDQHVSKLAENYLPPVCKRTSEFSPNEKQSFSFRDHLMKDDINKQILELGLVSLQDPDTCLKDIGENLLFEMACDYLGYNPMLSETYFVDSYNNCATQSTVVLSINEVGKQPKKVKFKIQIEEDYL